MQCTCVWGCRTAQHFIWNVRTRDFFFFAVQNRRWIDQYSKLKSASSSSIITIVMIGKARTCSNNVMTRQRDMLNISMLDTLATQHLSSLLIMPTRLCHGRSSTHITHWIFNMYLVLNHTCIFNNNLIAVYVRCRPTTALDCWWWVCAPTQIIYN